MSLFLHKNNFKEMQHNITMGAVRTWVWAADKNITIIQSSPSINVLWSEKLYDCNKKFTITKLTSQVFYPQYCFHQWKESLVWIRRETCTDQAQFTRENSPKLFQTNMLVDFDVREQQMDLSTGGSVIMDYGLWTGLWIFWPEATV